MSLLTLADVHFRYKNSHQQVDALRGVSCAFERGKVYAVVGKSGSGKTTLLSLIAGLDLPAQGEIVYDGTPTARMDLNRYRRENVSVIYQNFRLFPLLTAQENVMYPMELRGTKAAQAKARAGELIKRVGLDETTFGRFPNMLSGGEQQRVAIARALATNPMILLADEPTGALDQKTGKQVMQLFQDINNEGRTIIMITHDRNIAKYGNRIVRILDGELSEGGDLDDA